MRRSAKTSAAKNTLTNSQLRQMIKAKSGIKDLRIISPADVITAAWVRLKCQFGCSGYGECLVCPPYTPTPQQMRQILDDYRRAILIHFSAAVNVKAIIAQLERAIFLRGAWKVFALGSGPCYFCRSCPVESRRCKYPQRARPAMEACGIDVFTTARKAGFTLEVLRTTAQCPNYYGLILVD